MAIVARSLAEEDVQDAGVSGRVFAEELFATCMKTGGNLDLVLEVPRR